MGQTIQGDLEATAVALRSALEKTARSATERPAQGQSVKTALHASTVSAAAAEGPVSIGAYLRRQRMLRGISLDELESLTKLPRRSLERFEAGAYDGERDSFARGFVRTVAAALGVDQEEALARLWAGAALAQAAGPGRRSRAWQGIVAGLLGLLLGIALLWWLAPQIRSSSSGPAAAAVERHKVVYRRDAVRALVVSPQEEMPVTSEPSNSASPASAPASTAVPHAP